jgi:hypothetical protein
MVKNVRPVGDAMGVTGDTKCRAIFRDVAFLDRLRTFVEMANDLETLAGLNALITGRQHGFGYAILQGVDASGLAKLEGNIAPARRDLSPAEDLDNAQERNGKVTGDHGSEITKEKVIKSSNPGKKRKKLGFTS